MNKFDVASAIYEELDRADDLQKRNAALVEALEYIRDNTECSVARQWANKALKSAGSSANKARKSVDLSVLIDSGIDCCFEYDTQYWQCYSDDDFDFVNHRVVPRMDYWFSELNFDKPQLLIGDLYKAGFALESNARDDFKINGLQGGYCWPWECE